MSTIRAKDRDAVIQSLRAGVVPRVGQHLIQVGRVKELEALMKPMIDAAHAGSVAAVKAAVKGVGPLSPMMAHYASAARAQQARSASQKRVVRKGGRPATVRWRLEAKAIWDKNSLLTASDMLDKLESLGVVQRDAGYVVFTDEHGLRTEGGSEERKFLNSLKTLKNQHLGKGG